MNKFWKTLILPVIKEKKAKHIVEIGADTGKNTKSILEFCEENNAKLSCVDPFPKFEAEKWMKTHTNYFDFYKELSLSALPLIKDYDVVLIDGDHNWYTVYNELKIIQKTNIGKKFPIIFLHDTSWPYGRRDLYYNPENIPEIYRQPYKKMGIAPGTSSLVEVGGLNSHLYNSIYENNLQNGVLTAVEDFISESLEKLYLTKFEGFHGLSVITNEEDYPLIEYAKRNYINCVAELEMDRVHLIIQKNMINLEKIQITKELENLEKVQNETSLEKLHVLQELEDVKKQYKEAIHLLEEKNHAVNKLLNLQIEEQVNELRKEKEELNFKIKTLQKQIQEKEGSLIQSQIAANVHLNSIRYRLGDAIVLALKPSKHTLLAPYKIARLLLEGIQKQKIRKNTEQALNPKKKVENIECDKQRLTAQSNKKILSEEQARESYISIINENIKRIDTLLHVEKAPLVSIIILNRNGCHHLERLLKALKINTIYPNYEIIVVDNGSTDNSISLLENEAKNLPLTIIKNQINKNFSQANNQAAHIANGEYLLLMNNDIEPTYGWLNELMKCEQRTPNAGAIGAKLIYPYCPDSSINYHKSFRVQHLGIAFRGEEDFIRPYNMGNGDEPFTPYSNQEAPRAAVTAAVMLVKKEIYFKVNGLDESYNYGYEDVDFCLKLIKKGYTNVYCPTSLLFHYEFGTQLKDSNNDIKKRRLANKKIFLGRWNEWIKKQLLNDKLCNEKLFTEKKLKIAFAVTEYGENVSAGDYFTALDLGEAMKKFGWEITFLSRKGPEDWYKVDHSIDVLISMLDAYDPRKIKGGKINLIKIGWARNWFDRWAANPGLPFYDLVFASSQIACDFIKEKSGKDAFLLPIATNPERFNSAFESISRYECDYCFTGSFWNDPREIIDMLNPNSLPYKFNIYGNNWDTVEKFKPFSKGFVNYSQMPVIYNSTKIVIDDANRVTKPYGAVNSRVFDALASGALVLTNGELGSIGTFEGRLPVFKNKDELNKLLEFYLENEVEREKKILELKQIVLNNHTYTHRATTIKNILQKNIHSKTKVAIKVPVPKWEVAQEWGDYHFALALKKEFEKKEIETIIQILPDWDKIDDSDCDVILVLRGLSKYKPKPYHYNIMWNISHPDKIEIDEYNQYDHVFVASNIWAETLKPQCNVNIEAMLQCTDTDLFFPQPLEEYSEDILFVGNSRKVYRKIIKDLLPTNKPLSVYGTNWEMFLDKKYIKGEHIPNTELNKAYSSCKILLNDHWDDMREKGFISNRIFDGFASQAFIISDKIAGAEEIFHDALVTYESKEELKELIDRYSVDEELRTEKARKGYEIVMKNHTFESRVKRFIEVIKTKKI